MVRPVQLLTSVLAANASTVSAPLPAQADASPHNQTQRAPALNATGPSAPRAPLPGRNENADTVAYYAGAMAASGIAGAILNQWGAMADRQYDGHWRGLAGGMAALPIMLGLDSLIRDEMNRDTVNRDTASSGTDKVAVVQRCAAEIIGLPLAGALTGDVAARSIAVQLADSGVDVSQAGVVIGQMAGAIAGIARCLGDALPEVDPTLAETAQWVAAGLWASMVSATVGYRVGDTAYRGLVASVHSHKAYQVVGAVLGGLAGALPLAGAGATQVGRASDRRRLSEPPVIDKHPAD